jgi:Flp pilus assembly protein TadG
MLKNIKLFCGATGGLAAVEFGFIAPVLALLLLGTIELCNAMDCHQRVTTLAASTADLVAQETEVSDSDLTNIFSTVNTILYPFPTTNTSIVLTSIGGDSKVLWSKAQNGTQRATGSAVTVPAGLFPPGCTTAKACSVILAEVSYGYQSPLGRMIQSVMPMTDTFYARPRRSPIVAYP